MAEIGALGHVRSVMNNLESHELVRTMGFFGLVALLVAGYYLMKHKHKLFGVNSDLPSESSGARNYTSVQMFLVWLLMVKLFVYLTFWG